MPFRIISRPGDATSQAPAAPAAPASPSSFRVISSPEQESSFRVISSPEQENGDWGATFRALPGTIARSFQKGVGGVIQAVGEMPFVGTQEERDRVQTEMERTGASWEGAASSLGIGIGETKQRIAEYGEAMGERATEALAAIDPGLEYHSPEWWTFNVARVIGEMSPSVALTMMTRKPWVGATEMGLYVGGRQYIESRSERDRTPAEARQDSLVIGGFEILTERTPLRLLLGPGGKLLSRIAKTGAAEGGQEALAESLQIGYEIGVFGDEISLGDATMRVLDSMALGSAAGSSMAAVTEPFRRRQDVVREAADGAPSPAPTPEAADGAPSPPPIRVVLTPEEGAEIERFRQDYLERKATTEAASQAAATAAASQAASDAAASQAAADGGASQAAADEAASQAAADAVTAQTAADAVTAQAAADEAASQAAADEAASQAAAEAAEAAPTPEGEPAAVLTTEDEARTTQLLQEAEAEEERQAAAKAGLLSEAAPVTPPTQMAPAAESIQDDLLGGEAMTEDQIVARDYLNVERERGVSDANLRDDIRAAVDAVEQSRDIGVTEPASVLEYPAGDVAVSRETWDAMIRNPVVRESMGRALAVSAVDVPEAPVVTPTSEARAFGPQATQEAPIRSDIEMRLLARLKEVGIADRVALNVVDTLFREGPKHGEYRPIGGAYFKGGFDVPFDEEGARKHTLGRRLIAVAMRSVDKGSYSARQAERGTRFNIDTDWILDHEIIHALRDIGAINDTEWSTLRQFVGRDRKRMADIRSRYPELSEEAQSEEAIADAFADWARGKKVMPGYVRVFKSIRQFFENLGRALLGLGDNANAIFQAIDTGLRSVSVAGLRPGGSVPLEAKYAKPPRPPSMSELPKVFLDAYKRRADILWDRIENFQIPLLKTKFGKVFDPVFNLGPAYLAIKKLTQGTYGQILRIAIATSDAFVGLTDQQTEDAYAYMTTKGANPDSLPASHRHKIVRAKNMINKIGEKAKRAGILQGLPYADAYLPQLYLKHALDELHPDLMPAAGRAGKVPRLGWAEGRDPWLQQNPHIREILMGQIKDPRYLTLMAINTPLRDMVTFDFLQTVSENPEWAWNPSIVSWEGKKVSAMWAMQEAQRIHAMAESGFLRKDLVKEAHNAANKLEKLAEPALETPSGTEIKPKQWKQIPDTYRYGVLRGMWVKKEIYDDLANTFRMIPEDMSGIERWLGHGGVGTAIHGVWKTLTVAWNFPTVMRNIGSGIIQSHSMGNIFLHMVPVRIGQALNQVVRKKGQAYIIGRRRGIEASGYAVNEMGMLENDMRRIAKQKLSTWETIRAFVVRVYQIGPRAYGNVEVILKVAVIIDQLAKGATPDAAAAMAEKAIFDYSNVPKWVRYARNFPLTPAPFLSFVFLSTPRVIETGIKRPWKFVPWAIAIPYVIQYFMREWHDVDDDEIDKLRASMQVWLQEKGNVVILPMRDKNGNWVPVDIGYFFPWSPFVEFSKAIWRISPKDAAAALAFGGGPSADLIVLWKTSRDPFTGKLVTNPALPKKENFARLWWWSYNMVMPPWLGNDGAGAKIIAAFSGKVDPRSGEERYTKLEALLRMFGVSTHPFDPMESRRLNIHFLQRVIRDAEREMAYIMRDKSLSDTQKREDVDNQREHIRSLHDDLTDYMKRSQVPLALQ